MVLFGWVFFVCFGITCFVDIHSKNKFKYTSNILIFILMSKLYSIFRYVIVTFWMFFFFINLLVFAFIQFVPLLLLPKREREMNTSILACARMFLYVLSIDDNCILINSLTIFLSENVFVRALTWSLNNLTRKGFFVLKKIDKASCCIY